ncbi:MAG: deoxyribodipyrimidine photo-lyase, partial [Bdellovibrionota bacterium]|nr:deoxyribodipyrimidine photo-lyase [Bdellovibrionota bacterium]
MAKQKVHILWFRQDLRVKDNPALNALAEVESILPIFILDDENSGEFKRGGASRYWLHKSLDSLNSSLDSKLNLYHGKADEIIEHLVESYDVQSIHWNRCYEPWRMKRDKKIKDFLKSSKIEVESHKSDLLWEPWEVLKDDGDPYRVYSAYYKRLLKNTNLVRTPETKKIKADLVKDKSSKYLDQLGLFPKIKWYTEMDSLWQPGEKGAHKNFQKFLKHGIKNYKEGRDFPKLESVSRLSPHLHFGEISVAEIWHHVRNNFTDKNAGHFLKEIAWREFSYLLLYHLI